MWLVVKAFTNSDACSCPQARCQSTRCARGALSFMGNSKTRKHQLPLYSFFSSPVPSMRTQRKACRCSQRARGQMIETPQPPSTSCLCTNHQLSVQKSILAQENDCIHCGFTCQMLCAMFSLGCKHCMCYGRPSNRNDFFRVQGASWALVGEKESTDVNKRQRM